MAKLKPSQIRGTVSDWKIIVKQNDDLFREAVPSDFPTVAGQTVIVVNSPTHNAVTWEYLLVTTSADTTINLPAWQDGDFVKIKKFTWEDVFVITIIPNGSELIEGYDDATMNINRTMYTLTSINSNRYLGD